MEVKGPVSAYPVEQGKTQRTDNRNRPVRQTNVESEKSSQKSAGVEVSSELAQKQAARARAFDIAKNTPDVREDRVKELKAAIQSGKYQPDSGKIADGILREALKDKIAEGSL